MQEGAIDFPVPLLGFAAYSGTGKTTLLLSLLPLLKQTGLRIAVVKHAHHAFEMDRPGKDSYRLRTAGADEMLVAGKCRIGWVRECPDHTEEPRLTDVLAVLDPERLDLVLVEGFKAGCFPTDPGIVAIATDGGELACDPGSLPQLSINDPVGIADFVLRFIGREKGLQPEIAC